LLSQTVEYALRAAVCLANTPDAAQTTEKLAELTRVPQAYLAKVMQALVRARLATSQRGLHGGFLLTRPPGEICILDVVNAVDPIQRIERCPLGLAGHGVNLCPLHRRLDMALAMVEKAFASTTLADLLAEPSSSVPLCDTTLLGRH
jgi:Rrf2 family protein